LLYFYVLNKPRHYSFFKLVSYLHESPFFSEFNALASPPFSTHRPQLLIQVSSSDAQQFFVTALQTAMTQAIVAPLQKIVGRPMRILVSAIGAYGLRTVVMRVH
jgi:hypothetical protein